MIKGWRIDFLTEYGTCCYNVYTYVTNDKKIVIEQGWEL